MFLFCHWYFRKLLRCHFSVMVAMDKTLRNVGVFIILLTSGWGTLRDVLIESTPVFWLQGNRLFISPLLRSCGTRYFIRNQLKYVRRSYSCFDTIGIWIIYYVWGSKSGIAWFGARIWVRLHENGMVGRYSRCILCKWNSVIFKKKKSCPTAWYFRFGLGFLHLKQISNRRCLPHNRGLFYIVIGIRLLAVKFQNCACEYL